MITFEKVRKNDQEDVHTLENIPEKKPGIESEQELEDLGEKRIAGLSLQQGELGGENKINNSLGLSSEKFNELMVNSGVREKLEAISKQGQQYLGEAKTKIVEVAQTKEFNQIADATPFVGGAKRVTESVYGKTLSGEELSGKARLMHGAKGAVDLGLDFTGVGEVEKGAKLAYVGKKIVSGVKDNPEAFVNLGKKVIQEKEQVAQSSKETNTEINFSKPFSLKEATQEAADEQAKKPKKKTIEGEVEDFNKWQSEQQGKTKNPDENRAEITKRILKGENVGNIIKDLSKNNLRMENESDDNFQKPSERFGEVANKGKKEESPYESSFGYTHTIPLDLEDILSKKKSEKTDLNFEGSKEKWSDEEKRETKAEQENLRYREKITNPEVLKSIDENSEKVKQELKELEKNIKNKLVARDEKIQSKKEELENFLKGRDEALKEKKFLEEEIPRQEAYVKGIFEDIRERERKIQELENQGALGKFKNRDQIEKLKNEASGLAEYSYKKEKDKLGEYTNKLLETNNKLENDFSLKKVSSQMENAYDEWQKNLSYGGMTEANPEYSEKLELVVKKQLDFYEKNDLKREGLDKDSLRSEFSSMAGKLIYGVESDKSFYPIRNEKAENMPSMEASAYAIGIKNEDVDELLKSQEKLKSILTEDEMLTKKDFDTARYRAYYEARRTAQNVYTHVMYPDAIKKVIQDHALRSSLNLKNSGEAQYGIQRNEEAVYVTHGGGGYKNYGGRDFAFFAASGSDILSHDRSLSVATPGLREKGEAALGRQVAEFESDNGADMPVENMVFCCSERQVEDYKKIFLESGYSEEWINKSVIGIPDNVHDKMYEEDEASWDVYDKRHEQMPENENFVNDVVKSSLRDKNAFDDKIYATTASRKSRDNNTKIHKWMAVT